MKIYALTPHIYSNSTNKNTIKQKTFAGQNMKNSTDTVNFSKNNFNLSFGAAKGTYEWALDWNKDDRKKELDEQAKKSIKAMSLWKRFLTEAPNDLRQANRQMLEREEIMVTTLLQASAKLAEQHQKNVETMAQIETDKTNLRKWDLAARLSDAFKIENEGGLDDRIAGYEAEKQIIRNAYTEQVALEKAGIEANVPNAILLYGAIGTGKTTFARAVAEETGAKLVEMNPDPDFFLKEVRKELNTAKERYNESGQRTIIVVNEIEDFLEENKANERNIRTMKSWLDNCALIPSDDIQNASAATFIFTTNHPTDIISEILLRDEKIGSVIALEPAAEDNIKAIIEYYIDKFDKNGTLLENEKIDYDKIIELMNPDDNKGAFGNDRIKKIVKLALQDYSNDIDDKMCFEEHLINRINKAKRNIPPEKFQEYKEQFEYLSEE